jgi:hypothetical protein
MAAKKLRLLVLYSSIILKFMHKIYLNVFENGFKPVFYPTVIPSFQKSRLVRSVQEVVKF